MKTNPNKLFLFYLVTACFFLLLGPLACPESNNGNGTGDETSTGGNTNSPSAPLPPGALKIVAMGDSLTEGDGDDRFGADGPLSWPGRLQTQVAAVRSGSVVINLGRSGWDSQMLIGGNDGQPGQLPQAISENPNVACVWIGSNDLWYTNNDDEGAAVSQFSSNIDTILRRLTDAGVRVYIALLDDQSKRPSASQNYNAEERARMSHRVSLYNAEITRLAAQYGATTVDFFNTTIFTNPATLSDDGNHPNSTGYDQIADIWFDAIRPSL